MNYIYLLKCSDGSYYTGWTNDPRQRLACHNKGAGGKYTRSRLPVQMVYLEKCPDDTTPLKREYYIRKLTHKKKTALVSSPDNIVSDFFE